MNELIEALKHQQQCDEDGTMCIVSRQAVDEAIAAIAADRNKRATPQIPGYVLVPVEAPEQVIKHFRKKYAPFFDEKTFIGDYKELASIAAAPLPPAQQQGKKSAPTDAQPVSVALDERGISQT